MALSRRQFVVGAPLAACTLAACAPTGSRVSAPATAYEEVARAGRPQGDRVVVLMPETPQTRDVWTGLSDELGRDYELVAVRVDRREDSSVVAQALRSHAPRAVVLMNNPTVAAYSEFQRLNPRSPFPPAVIAMTSFLDEQRGSVLHATGITYEVPLITVVTNLRKLIDTPVARIGVVRREPLAAFVRKQAALAAHERIDVQEEVVGPNPNASELKRALRRVRARTDVLWVLNDDRLLTPSLIVDAWVPGVSERPWIPTIVGAAPLVAPRLSFGTFAVLPDHAALGAQIASLVFDLADAGWSLEPSTTARLPLSTTTTVDLAQAKERFVLRDGALAYVDRVLR